jgi:hypothetical protein
VPPSAWRNAYAICSSENRDFFIVPSSLQGSMKAAYLYSSTVVEFRANVASACCRLG